MKTHVLVLLALLLLCPAAFAEDEAPITDLSEHQPALVEGEASFEGEAFHENSTQLKQQIANLIEMNLPAKIEELQQQMQILKGEIEKKDHQLKLLKEQQKNFYQDLDDRLNQLQAKPTQTLNVSQTKTSNPLIEQDLSNMDIYKKAIGLIQEKKYEEAHTQLTDYLKRFPDDKLAPNAHFWLGEIYYKQGKNESAQQEFETVTREYPMSQKVPAAMLKLGYIEASNGNTEKAKKILNDIVKHFQGSPTARLAEIKLKNL